MIAFQNRSKFSRCDLVNIIIISAISEAIAISGCVIIVKIFLNCFIQLKDLINKFLGSRIILKFFKPMNNLGINFDNIGSFQIRGTIIVHKNIIISAIIDIINTGSINFLITIFERFACDKNNIIGL